MIQSSQTLAVQFDLFELHIKRTVHNQQAKGGLVDMEKTVPKCPSS